MTEIEILGFAPSTYVRSARMACHLARVPHTLAPLAFKEASHLALHPFGKMPILRDGDVVVFETLAILSYIDDRFHDGGLQPRPALARARMLQWASAAIDYFYPALVSGLLSEQPDDAAIAAAGEVLKLLDGALAGHAYLVDDSESLADLLCFPMIDFALHKLGAETATGLPNLRGYHARIDAWPAARETRS